MEELTCSRCGRKVQIGGHRDIHGNVSAGAYVYVVHSFYGCDTGCCGHVAFLCDEEEHVVDSHFEFDHPFSGEFEEFAREFSESAYPGVTLRLDLCEIVDD